MAAERRRPAGRPRASPAGFTLLEVLVAFIIAALALAVLYQGGIGGLAATQTAHRYEEALSRAQSHLAVAGAGPDIQPQDRQGDEGAGYHWHVRIAPVSVAAMADPSRPRPALYAIAVTLSWQDGRRTREVTLQTERAGTAPPAPP